MNDTQKRWLQKLKQLNPNTSKSKGKAPHKPLLLLCLVDLAREGLLTTPVVQKSPDLRLRFDSLWAIVQDRWGGRPGIDLPFHHLRTQNFRETRTRENRPSHSADTTHSIELNPGFFSCLQDREFLQHGKWGHPFLTFFNHRFNDSVHFYIFGRSGFHYQHI